MVWSKQKRQMTLSIVTSQSILHYVLLWRQPVGSRTHEPLFTQFSRYSPNFLVNVACYVLQDVIFSANGIAYTTIDYRIIFVSPFIFVT
jgi:hypothetical protein